IMRGFLAAVVAVALISSAAQLVPAQGKGQAKKEAKKEAKQQKKLEKEAKKLAKQADKASRGLGRNVVFCILEAHTDVGSAEELRDKFETLTDFPFGQFVAAVLLADRLDDPDFSLDAILMKLQEGMSIGQITKEAGEDMGEMRRGFGQFRSELARSMTNPPTRDCFSSDSE
ncbi:MAG TPA: hypothetical protein VNO14_11875, partial [Blastocatellia bacterium]|nr:hypothetical protein [Blastocatellia bacterium]